MGKGLSGMYYLELNMLKNALAAGIQSQTPLRELTALSRPSNWLGLVISSDFAQKEPGGERK